MPRRQATVGVIIAILCLSAVGSARGDAKVEEQVVGPAGTDNQYVVSPHGGHVAIVTHKGTHLVVVVDGVAGPQFNEIITANPKVAQSSVLVASFTAGVPVVFSNDGSRYAYLGRREDDWILVIDGKEAMHVPVAGHVSNQTGITLNMAFTGPAGKHLMFAYSTFAGMLLWVDGKQTAAPYTNPEPVASPDGQHYAYPAILNKKQVLIVDGQDAGYFAANPQFTADSKHLVTIADLPNGQGQALLLDGKPRLKASNIVKAYVSPYSDAIVTVARQQTGNTQSFFLDVNGAKAEATVAPQPVNRVVFSPDGKRWAAVIPLSGNKQCVVCDGKKGENYDAVEQESLVFSPDSSKLAYVAHAAGKQVWVINADESDIYWQAMGIAFSADGKHVAYSGRKDGNAKPIMIDGKAEDLKQGSELRSFQFSPDGSHYAYCTQSPGGIFMMDGKATGLGVQNYTFSPDGKHYAAPGSRASDNHIGLWVDGELVSDRPEIRYRAFTPDSRHLFWMQFEPVPGGAPGQYRYLSYLDGKPVGAIDRNPTATQFVGIATGSMGSGSPGWEVGPDGVLTMAGPVGDSVKRFRVTPSADTSVDTMLADVKAAQAKAAADAAAAAAKAKAKRGGR